MNNNYVTIVTHDLISKITHLSIYPLLIFDHTEINCNRFEVKYSTVNIYTYFPQLLFIS